MKMEQTFEMAVMLGSARCDRLSLRDGAEARSLPSWAEWLIRMGQWMRFQAAMPGRRVAIVRLPTRRLGGPLAALGAMFAASRLHDDSLDWATLQSLPQGAVVHWLEPYGRRKVRCCGRVDSVQYIGGEAFLAISVEKPPRSRGATFFLPRATALAYGVTLGAVSERSEEQLAGAGKLLREVVEGASTAWLRSPNPDSTLIAEVSTLLDEISGISLVAGQTCNVAFADALALCDSQRLKHGKTLLLSSRSEPGQDAPEGLTILNGSSSVSKLPHAKARSILLLLDYAEHDEVVMHEILPFMGVGVDAGLYPPGDAMPSVPPGVEVFAFGLPANGQVDR